MRGRKREEGVGEWKQLERKETGTRTRDRGGNLRKTEQARGASKRQKRWRKERKKEEKIEGKRESCVKKRDWMGLKKTNRTGKRKGGWLKKGMRGKKKYQVRMREKGVRQWWRDGKKDDREESKDKEEKTEAQGGKGCGRVYTTEKKEIQREMRKGGRSI